MTISFNPPLDTATVLAVPSSYRDGAELDLCFSAKFTSADAPAPTERVELWSNIPVSGRAAGSWGALEFVDEDSDEAQDHGSSQEHTTLRLRFTTHIPARGTQFSYTYRIMSADGSTRWLGQYGRDGVLLIERADPRIKLTPGLGWSVRPSGETTAENIQDAYEAEVARLNPDLAWSAWTVDRAGHAVFHDSLSNLASSSTASLLVLLPSTPEDAIVVNHPLVLTTSKITSLSVSPLGQIRAKASSKTKGTLHLRTYNGTTDLQTFVKGALDATDTAARLVSVHAETGHALLASPANMTPTELAFIPFTVVNVSARALVLPRSLAGLLPAGEDDEFCVLQPDLDQFAFVSSASSPLIFSASPTGERMLVTTAYGLPGSSSVPEMTVVLLGPHDKLEVTAFIPSPVSQLPSPPLTPNHFSHELPMSIAQVLKPIEKTSAGAPIDTEATLDGVTERLSLSRTDTTNTFATANTDLTYTDAATIATGVAPPVRASSEQDDCVPASDAKPTTVVDHEESTPDLDDVEDLPFPPTPQALLNLAVSQGRRRSVKRSLLKTILFGLLRASAVVFGFVAARILGAMGLGRVIQKIQEQIAPERRALGSRMSRVGLSTGAASSAPPLSRRHSTAPGVSPVVGRPPVQEPRKPEETSEPKGEPEQPEPVVETAAATPIAPLVATEKQPLSPLCLSLSKPTFPSLLFSLGSGPRMMLFRPSAPLKPSALIQGLTFKLDGIPFVPEIASVKGGTFALRIAGDTPARLEVSHVE